MWFGAMALLKHDIIEGKMIHLYSAFDKVVIIQVQHRFVYDKTYILHTTTVVHQPKIHRPVFKPQS